MCIREPTHETRAEAKLAWAMPCKKEEDEVKSVVEKNFLWNLCYLCDLNEDKKDNEDNN